MPYFEARNEAGKLIANETMFHLNVVKKQTIQIGGSGGLSMLGAPGDLGNAAAGYTTATFNVPNQIVPPMIAIRLPSSLDSKFVVSKFTGRSGDNYSYRISIGTLSGISYPLYVDCYLLGQNTPTPHISGEVGLELRNASNQLVYSSKDKLATIAYVYTGSYAGFSPPTLPAGRTYAVTHINTFVYHAAYGSDFLMFIRGFNVPISTRVPTVNNTAASGQYFGYASDLPAGVGAGGTDIQMMIFDVTGF